MSVLNTKPYPPIPTLLREMLRGAGDEIDGKQAQDDGLDDIAGLTPADSNIIVGDGTNWVAESGATARTSLELGTGNSPEFTAVNIGHASDTTLTRVSAGRAAIEGSNVIMESDIGTSGAVLGRLNANKTDSGTNTFSGANTFTSQNLTLTYSNDGAGAGPRVDLFRESASPAASDAIGQMRILGRNTSASQLAYGSMLCIIASPTAGAESLLWQFLTFNGGTLAARMQMSAGVYHSAATGGDKGNGTLNFSAVYDDNVLLTCYIIDAVEGKFRVADWDRRVPDTREPILNAEGKQTGERIITRVHDGARKFAARLGTEYDPLDPEKYWQHYVDKRHLTAFPNPTKFAHSDLSTGHWVQRIVETVETLAYHDKLQRDAIKALTARVTKLEAEQKVTA